MKSIGTALDGRKIYTLWTCTDDFKLVEVQALQNNNPEYFWVPKLEFTSSLGCSLFETKEQAKIAAEKVLLSMVESLNIKKRNLEL